MQAWQLLRGVPAAAAEPKVRWAAARGHFLSEFTISSGLSAPQDVVWRHVVSPAGVNRELRPLLRMTFPRGIEDLTEHWQAGERLFRSWLLLGGLLPVDYDDVVLSEVDPGTRLLECSSLFSQRVWEHERVVSSAAPDRCTLTDRVRFVPRIPWLEHPYGAIFRALFTLRHRNLRREFGQAAA